MHASVWSPDYLKHFRSERKILTLYGTIMNMEKKNSVLPVPEHFIEEINKLSFNVIWAGNVAKNLLMAD